MKHTLLLLVLAMMFLIGGVSSAPAGEATPTPSHHVYLPLVSKQSSPVPTSTPIARPTMLPTSTLTPSYECVELRFVNPPHNIVAVGADVSGFVVNEDVDGWKGLLSLAWDDGNVRMRVDYNDLGKSFTLYSYSPLRLACTGKVTIDDHVATGRVYIGDDVQYLWMDGGDLYWFDGVDHIRLNVEAEK